MPATPTLSLAMIVRDEAPRLAGAVESVRALVDEIVVVDTGSADGTPEIARSLGARVLFHAWADDFAAARNASIDASTGAWILALDADERVAAADHGAIRAAIGRDGVLGCFVRQFNRYPGGCHAIRTLRLWRRHPEARFRYPIHEQILPSLAAIAVRTGERIEALPVGIEHFGYAQTPEITRRKLGRNARIMARYLADRPDDLYMRYLHGGTLEQLGDRPGAHAALAQAFARFERLDPVVRRALDCGPNLVLLHARALLEAGEVEGARVLAFGRSLFPDDPALLYLEAWQARREGRWVEAALAFERCAAMEPSASPLHTAEGVTGADAWAAAGDTWRALGELPRARTAYERALREAPANERSVVGLAAGLATEGRAESALELLEAYVRANRDSGAAWASGAAVLLDRGDLARAGEWAERAGAAAPEDPQVRLIVARLRVRAGDYARAIESVSGAPRTPLLDVAGLLGAALAGTATPAFDALHEADAQAGAQLAFQWIRDLSSAGRRDAVGRLVDAIRSLVGAQPRFVRAFFAIVDASRAASRRSAA